MARASRRRAARKTAENVSREGREVREENESRIPPQPSPPSRRLTSALPTWPFRRLARTCGRNSSKPSARSARSRAAISWTPIRFRLRKIFWSSASIRNLKITSASWTIARNHTLLQTKLAELGHANCQIKFIKAEAPVGSRSQAANTVAAPTSSRGRFRHNNQSPQQRAWRRGAPPPEKKIRAGCLQQGHFQERSADPKGAGNFQRPRLWKSARDFHLNPQLSTIN